jgi:serine/threonine protein kinase
MNHPFVLGETLTVGGVKTGVSFIDYYKGEDLSESVLLGIVKRDMGEALEYLLSKNKDSNTNFKVIKRDNLSPYVPLSDVPFAYGGFSELYLCKNSETGEVVVRKVLKMGGNNDVKEIELMISEVEIMLTIKESAFTLELMEYFIFENKLNLIIQYCNGGNLYDYTVEAIKHNKLLPLNELNLIAWSIACGLYNMHSLRMMHRDIKPQNVLVIKDGEKLIDVKLSDYGFGKKVDLQQSLRGSTILGTNDYFAPEMIEAIKQLMMGDAKIAKYDEKVDVWSYGILLYFLLFGKTPRESPVGGFGVVQKQDIKYPAYPPEYKPYVDLVNKCLTVKSKDRPGFKEILKDPFLNTFYFQARTSMSPYTLGKLIAEGRHTKVYEGKKKKNMYAMKVLNLQTFNQKQVADEASTLLKAFSCKNVVHLYDHFLYKNTLYFVLDYYSGGNLKKYIFEREKNSKPLTPKEQISVAFEILKGIKAIHSRNIVHRDICPENIVINTDTKHETITSLALCDLGFSKVLLPDEGTETIIGTYRSPELSRAHIKGEYGTKTDIWSFGMTLYFIMFGMDMFFANGFSLSELYNEGVVPLNEKRLPLVVKELIEVMMSCFKVDPDERPSAASLLKNSIFIQTN